MAEATNTPPPSSASSAACACCSRTSTARGSRREVRREPHRRTASMDPLRARSDRHSVAPRPAADPSLPRGRRGGRDGGHPNKPRTLSRRATFSLEGETVTQRRTNQETKETTGGHSVDKQTSQNTSRSGGATGARSRDLRIKSPPFVTRFRTGIARVWARLKNRREPTVNQRRFFRVAVGVPEVTT